MRVLITGITGFLGPYLNSALLECGERDVVGTARGFGPNLSCDLTNAAAVKSLMETVNPDIVVHAAAMTNVDECQKDPVKAWATNVEATKYIVQYMPLRGKLIYISTDMVYSGPGPHSVDGDTVNPVNVYGMTKYMGELEALKFPNSLVLRTNMYGVSKGNNRKSSFVDFLLGAFKSEAPINIFTDLQFSPIYVETLAERIAEMALTSVKGTYNLSASDGMPKSRFAMLIASKLGYPIPFVTPSESDNIPGRAPRPKDTRMVPHGFMAPMEADINRMCEKIKSWRTT